MPDEIYLRYIARFYQESLHATAKDLENIKDHLNSALYHIAADLNTIGRAIRAFEGKEERDAQAK